MFFNEIHSAEDIAAIVNDVGFLPFFHNEIEGFSIEECCPKELWFSDTNEGPWEWKGPVIRMTGCAYGKYYKGKACYISKDWFSDFANYRRDGYDYDARIDEGIARNRDRKIMQVLLESDELVSKTLKMLSMQAGQKRTDFDSCLAFLQMQAYITITDFEYQISKSGNVFGWGLAKYATPEAHFGKQFTDNVYAHKPEESRKRLFEYLKKTLPQATDAQIDRFIG